METLPSVELRMKYANTFLGDPVYSQHGRTVFKVNEHLVLKLAYNYLGSDRNKHDVVVSESTNSNIVPKVYAADKKNAWTIAERVVKPRDSRVLEGVLALHSDVMFEGLEDLVFITLSEGEPPKDLWLTANTIKFVKELSELFTRFEIPRHIGVQKKSWGIVTNPDGTKHAVVMVPHVNGNLLEAKKKRRKLTKKREAEMYVKYLSKAKPKLFRLLKAQADYALNSLRAGRKPRDAVSHMKTTFTWSPALNPFISPDSYGVRQIAAGLAQNTREASRVKKYYERLVDAIFRELVGLGFKGEGGAGKPEGEKEKHADKELDQLIKADDARQSVAVPQSA